MRDFAERSRDGLGDIIEDDEESGMPGPDYVQLLEELFGSLCGEDDSGSTLVNDQVERARLLGKRTALLLSSFVLSYASPYATHSLLLLSVLSFSTSPYILSCNFIAPHNTS